MKLLIIAPYYPITEKKVIGTWAHNQALALEEIGCSVDVVCPSPYIPDLGINLPENIQRWAELPSEKELDGLTIKYPKIPVIETGITNNLLWERYPHSQNIASWTFTKKKFSKLLNTNSYDGILCHNVIPAAHLGQKAKEIANIPVTLILHSYDELLRASNHRRTGRIFERAIENADTVATVSHKMANKAKEIVATDFTITRNGYDVQEVQSTKAIEEKSQLTEGKTITCVGAFTYRKGQTVLIEAWNLLQDRIDMSDKSLVLVGGGPKETEIRNLIQKYNLTESVGIESKLTRRELNLLFRDSYAFVLPSWNEPCAVVYTEAMPYGTPIVATEGEGFSELITDGENGYLVGPQDIDDLSETLYRIFSNEDEAIQVGERGREFVESNLQWKDNAESIIETFK